MNPRAILMAILMVLVFVISGCDGDTTGLDGVDGQDGVNGVDGINGQDGQDGFDGFDGQDGTDGQDGLAGAGVFLISGGMPEELNITITGVTVNSPPVVQFTVVDGHGRGAVGLPGSSGRNVRFTIAKLVPGTNGEPTIWQSYLNKVETSSLDDVTTAIQATYEYNGDLVDNGDGSYEYTFAADIANITTPIAVTYDGSLTHRIGMQVDGNDGPAANGTFDFVPDGGVASQAREIAMTSTCNECHGDLTIHGSRKEMKYCVVCHNPGSVDAETGNSVDMPTMIHKIHRGMHLPSVAGPDGEFYDDPATPADESADNGEYAIIGYKESKHDYSHVGYPQEIQNCMKCHNGDDAETPMGNNWKMQPNMAACGACHDDVDFATHGATAPQTDNSGCVGCHSPSAIEGYHLLENATPNNPDVPAGAVNFEYVINSATVTADIATVNFSILMDGVAITDLDTTYPPTGFTRGPDFLLAYALPQDGITEPADWNNLGTYKSQPLSIGIDDIFGTADLVAGAAAGTFDAILTTVPFPAGATMRAVALQGYFNQIAPDVSRHTPSVVVAIDGDDERRQIIDYNGCLDCHERLEFHNGARVIAAETDIDSPNICITCHVPNLSSSGNTFDIASYVPGDNPGSDTTIATYGNDPMLYPEAAQNFKDMIHGIHAASMREVPYEHVRLRSGNAYTYDWSHVTYPGELSNCTKCHLDDSYAIDAVPEEALMSINITAEGGVTNLAEALAVRDTIPNANDSVNTPVVSACYTCHNDAVVAGHMDANTGMLDDSRTNQLSAGPSQCGLCHDSGSLADVELVHPGLN